jgi:hypothetical protein
MYCKPHRAQLNGTVFAAGSCAARSITMRYWSFSSTFASLYQSVSRSVPTMGFAAQNWQVNVTTPLAADFTITWWQRSQNLIFPYIEPQQFKY